MSKVALIVLAAGEASRMGRPKQLLEVGGKAMVRLVVDNGWGSRCRPVVVVLGAHADLVRGVLAGSEAIAVENPRWREGMGTSIHTGVAEVEKHDADAAILMLADQPLVDAAVLNRLVALYETTGRPIVTAEYAETVGVPVLFAREFFPKLLALDAGQGCKGVILKHRNEAAGMPCPEAEADIDTPEDYRRLLAKS